MNYDERRAEINNQIHGLYEQLRELTRMQQEEEIQYIPLGMEDLSDEQFDHAANLVIAKIYSDMNDGCIVNTIEPVLNSGQYHVYDDIMTGVQMRVFENLYIEKVKDIVMKKLRGIVCG